MRQADLYIQDTKICGWFKLEAKVICPSPWTTHISAWTFITQYEDTSHTEALWQHRDKLDEKSYIASGVLRNPALPPPPPEWRLWMNDVLQYGEVAPWPPPNQEQES